MEYRHLFCYTVSAVAAIILTLTVITGYRIVSNTDYNPVSYREVIRSTINENKSVTTCISRDNDTNCLQRRLPKCLIIGFAKCGTYALRSFLALHPDIVAAEEEVAFFNNNFNKGFDWYLKQMPLSSESQITLEKTPGYVLSRSTLARIHDFNSSIKLIITVRDPVTRIPSWYAHLSAHGSKKTFNKWIQTTDYVKKMNYHQYIEVVYTIFPRNQILVLCEEELQDYPLAAMKEVETFLGLRPAFNNDLFIFDPVKGFYCFNQSHPRFKAISQVIKTVPETGCFSKSKGREHPDISPDLQKELATRAYDYNERLFTLIGKRFNWTRP